MPSQDLEERLKNIESNAKLLLEEINSLRSIDSKLDALNSILHDINNAANLLYKKVDHQEVFLQELKVSADFRKRESENSVREIKTQMNTMEIHNKETFRDVVDEILTAIKESENASNKRIENFTLNFEKKIGILEQKIRSVSNTAFFSIGFSVIAIGLIFFL
jgi:formate dehydrogenase maturation protein FdhE